MSNREKWGTKIPRSGGGLRDHLFEQLERLRDGHIETAEAQATAGLSNAIVKTVEVQLKYEQMLIKGDVSNNLSALGVLEAPIEKKTLPNGISGAKVAESPTQIKPIAQTTGNTKKTA